MATQRVEAMLGCRTVPTHENGRPGRWRLLGLATRCLLLVGVMGASACGSASPGRTAAPAGPVELIGSATIPSGAVFQSVEVGGLSGLAFDTASGRYLAISDDRSEHAPARFFTLDIDLQDGRLSDDDVRVVDVTTLRDAAGGTFPERSVDPEGIALLPDGSVLITSEGDVGRRVSPFLRHFARDGRQLGEVALPECVLPRPQGGWGVRDNLALESLTVSVAADLVLTATENALVQDGPAADLTTGSLSRILRLTWPGGLPAGELVYPVAPVSRPPATPQGFRTNGLPDLLWLDREHCLALERASAEGAGYSVRLFLVSLSGASDVTGVASLSGRNRASFTPATKQELLDLAKLGIRLQNIESMTLGPLLADGRQVLLLLADNNFGRRGDQTQLLAFALRRAALADLPPRAATIAAIQGSGHASALFGEAVASVWGVVTAVQATASAPGFWMQSTEPDADVRTSEGIFVTAATALPPVAVGDLVRVSGRVDEPVDGLGLPVTRLVAGTVEVTAHGHELPQPVVIGSEGRRPPQETVEDDGFTVFDPDQDAADFFEGLEGMRVAVRDAVVVGPTSRYGELVVLPGDVVQARRTTAGGITVAPGKLNPQRVVVSCRLVQPTPEVAVGDRFEGSLVGVLDYSFGGYKLVLTEPPVHRSAGGTRRETSALSAGPGRLTIASVNAENLALTSSEAKFRQVASVITRSLQAPDIVALQEVQDDSGSADDGTVTAHGTLERLVEAIVEAGGPRYQFRQIDPEDNRDGGAPGANIRLAFLFRPEHVSFVDRGAAGPRDATHPVAAPGDVTLSLSPGRVEPAHQAWQRDPSRGFESSRKPLTGELLVGGTRLVVVALHLKSKGGDAPLFGREQPPSSPTERQRLEQAEVMRSFVAGILDQRPDAAVVVLGDCNDFELSPPLEVLKAAPLVDLAERLDPGDRYSFVFQGNSQLLDHILVSPAVAAGAEVDIVHVNADFPETARASDHDPIVARIAVTPAAQ